MTKIVKANNLHKNYKMDNRTINVLKGVDISIDAGETVAVVGPSGAGKSTLLHQLGLLELPSEGQVFIEEQETNTLNDHTRARLRLNKIGFVFQFHHLLPEFTALENVMLPGLVKGIDRSTYEDRAQKLLKQVQLSDRVAHKPGELSGGEQQRVALARALMNDPILILADEPTGNLDREASVMLRELLWSICRDRGAALLVVTHNEILAGDADQILVMTDGRFGNGSINA